MVARYTEWLSAGERRVGRRLLLEVVARIVDGLEEGVRRLIFNACRLCLRVLGGR